MVFDAHCKCTMVITCGVTHEHFVVSSLYFSFYVRTNCKLFDCIEIARMQFVSFIFSDEKKYIYAWLLHTAERKKAEMNAAYIMILHRRNAIP